MPRGGAVRKVGGLGEDMTNPTGLAVADVHAERREQRPTGAGRPEIVEERGVGSGDQSYP